LLALIIGDTPIFAWSRTVLMSVSFVALLEFSRIEAARLGLRMPGRWVYAPLFAFIAGGDYLAGLDGANSFARYALGLTGAAGTAIVLSRHVSTAPRAEQRWIVAAVIGFGLYAIAAGFVVPGTKIWPATIFNYANFTAATGIPIQFIRGVLACAIAMAIWGVWG